MQGTFPGVYVQIRPVSNRNTGLSMEYNATFSLSSQSQLHYNYWICKRISLYYMALHNMREEGVEVYIGLMTLQSTSKRTVKSENILYAQTWHENMKSSENT